LKVLRVAKYDDDVASRQKLLRGWQQEILENAKVLVVGAGALGNEVVKNLVMVGVGTIYAVDFDVVVTSNLNRCIFFRREDARKGRSKVRALAERATELSPYDYTRVIPIEADVHHLPHDHEVYVQSQVYVSCLDNLAARLELNEAAVHNGKPLVDGGMSGYIGHAQVVIPGRTACLACDIGELELKSMYDRLSCSGSPLEFSGPKVPALPTVTSALGAIMAQEVVKLLLGKEHYAKEGEWLSDVGIPLAGKRAYLNMRLNVYGVYDVERNPNCPACSTLNKVFI
jgi:molybdopterin/thiamine biosynthesis adenylyltransferase